jgi:hypothetical protein
MFNVKEPTLSRQSAHRWRYGCQPYALAALHSPETLLFSCLWYSILFEAEAEGLVRPEGLGKFKNHLIGYRTRDMPVYSIVP